MANEIGRNVLRFFGKVEESITENKICKLCSKSVNDNAVFLQLERLKFMFFIIFPDDSDSIYACDVCIPFASFKLCCCLLYAPVICIHGHPPTGISGLRCRAITF